MIVMKVKSVYHWLPSLLAPLLLSGCSMIDEDLSDCRSEGKLDYELQLVTNMTTELQTELGTQTDIGIAGELREYLSDIFTDFAHDVDLSFYDTQGDSLRLQHDRHIMDANQASYSLNLPMDKYMHLAVANIVDDPLISLVQDERCHTSRLQQLDRDTIDSHNTGLFTARQPMEVLGNVNQNFNVHLFMANCAAALVIDPKEHPTDNIQVFSKGFATGFNICDSTFQYAAKDPVVRTTRLKRPSEDKRMAFCSVSFPSRQEAATRSIIETTEPFVSKNGDKVLWEFAVYVQEDDGTITRTVLGLTEPLLPGELIIITGWIGQKGEILPDRQDVAISITTNWEKGMQSDIPL